MAKKEKGEAQSNERESLSSNLEFESKEAAQSSKPVKPATSNKQPATSPPKSSGGLMPVEELAEAKNIKSWEVAGLMRAAGWAPGKQVTKEDFDQTLGRFRRRPQGGGRI